MTDKMLRIDGDLHKRVKLAATMADMTIKEFTERALRSWIAPAARTLIDTRATYSINPRYDCNPNETD